eukprot:15451852-Alexandrium_andersonii.AAC.1
MPPEPSRASAERGSRESTERRRADKGGEPARGGAAKGPRTLTRMPTVQGAGKGHREATEGAAGRPPAAPPRRQSTCAQ